MTDELAGAIVAYRKQHGPFEDFEALLKVPGLNRDALEKKRDAITF
jgi:competence ComEA-like helix-hairpin-helix protein